MGAKSFELYQGSDWMTYRWTVAQAFETLDRMREVCMPLLPQDLEAEPYAYDSLGLIADLSDDLFSEFEIVTADLFPVLQANVAHRWAVVEMRIHFDRLRLLCLEDHNNNAHDQLAQAADLLQKIKLLLKRIDQ
jgi:hypothetical protein